MVSGIACGISSLTSFAPVFLGGFFMGASDSQSNSNHFGHRIWWRWIFLLLFFDRRAGVRCFAVGCKEFWQVPNPETLHRWSKVI
jgi:hypothetical protein